uniref:(northern house mosquito) hypothetical protein n=1 Tax=Culex pipiens TaxID=7175 RepID=A0A8D8MX30_CULPI
MAMAQMLKPARNAHSWKKCCEMCWSKVTLKFPNRLVRFSAQSVTDDCRTWQVYRDTWLGTGERPVASAERNQRTSNPNQATTTNRQKTRHKPKPSCVPIAIRTTAI